MKHKPGSSARLTQLVDLASRKEQEAGARLREQRVELDKMLAELTMLRQYRIEYAESSMTQDTGFSATRLRNLQQFIKTLDEAVQQKTSQMQVQQDAVEQARLVWLDFYQRNDALTRVRDGRKQLERLDQARRDQAMDDELVNSRIGDSDPFRH